MSKQNLPKHWIIVKSKSHPDRVYYFNIKTNISSWVEPTDDMPVEAKRKTKQTDGKGAKLDEEREVKKSKPSTPPRGNSFVNETPQRKKLVARRSLQQAKQKASAEKDTPQMKALREKIQKKKESMASPKSSSSEVSNNKTLRQRASKVLCKETLSVSLPKIDVKDRTRVSSCTPQMRAIFEKLQNKTSEGHLKKKSKESPNVTDNLNERRKSKTRDEVKLRLPRHSSASSESNISESATRTENLSRTSSIERNSVQKARTRKKFGEASSPERSITRRKRRSSLQKNLAADRMDTFRRKLSLEKEKLEKSINSSKSLEDDEESITKNKVSLPHIYKNAQVRLVRLKNKLLKDKLPPHKNVTDNSAKDLEGSALGSATTVTDLVNQSVESAFYEEMDWEPMEDEKITTEVQTVRTELCADNNTCVNSNVPHNVLSQSLSPAQKESRQLYIVIDTNVLLSDIRTVDLVRETDFKTYDRPIIVIPWTVIRELDYIKDNKHNKRSEALCTKARRAVQYLNKLFASKNQRVSGQTPEDAAKNKERFAVDCPDDEILQTCLQIRDLGKSVVLLTYDKNLCNKAMIYDIVTLGRNDPIEKLDYLNASINDKGLLSPNNSENKDRETLDSMSIMDEELHMSNEMFDEISIVIRDFLSVIISMEMRVLYGESWEKYVIIRPPWTTVTALKCAIKHWIAATSESFLRQAEGLLRNLLSMFESSSLKRLNDVGHLLEQCNDLFQMVNTDKHMDLMLRASEKIKELKITFLQFKTRLNEKKIREMIGVENNTLEQHERAEKAFKYFEKAYAYARDISGWASEVIGMSCNIPYDIPNPVPPLESIKHIQPELAVNVNRLLYTLGALLNEASSSSINPRTLINLCDILRDFPAESIAPDNELTPLDIYCCVKQKEEVLQTGLRQLQELSTHFCRLANYRCT